jgi:site-specific DNA-adenine methylase
LRYAGGKRWFYDEAKKFVEQQRPSVFIGLFAGGATVELSLLAANLCDHLVLVEKDPRVAAFWRVALSSDSFARRVAKFIPTTESVTRVLSASPKNDDDWAFWVYLKSRTSFNGILHGGLSVSEIDWSWKTIPVDLYQIRALASRITFIEGCALDILSSTTARAMVPL